MTLSSSIQWIVLFGHRPPYCSSSEDECGTMSARIRVGLPQSNGTLCYGIEALLLQYDVDLAIWGHRHSYERMLPVFDGKLVVDSSDATDPYHNAKAPVHIITGSAGCDEGTTSFDQIRSFSAFRSRDYGWSRLELMNQTNLLWQQISVNQSGAVIDEIWLSKDEMLLTSIA